MISSLYAIQLVRMASNLVHIKQCELGEQDVFINISTNNYLNTKMLWYKKVVTGLILQKFLNPIICHKNTLKGSYDKCLYKMGREPYWVHTISSSSFVPIAYHWIYYLFIHLFPYHNRRSPDCSFLWLSVPNGTKIKVLVHIQNI